MSNKLMVRAGAAAALGALAVATTAVAQNGAPPVNVRGTVVSFSGNALKVKSREGKAVDVALPTGWRLSSVANTTLESIKPGDFVGIASVPNAKGDRALEVLVFPPELKGAGEGSYGWDLKPKSNMTNASVSNLVKGVNGRTVTLTYGGQQKTITIPERTPDRDDRARNEQRPEARRRRLRLGEHGERRAHRSPGGRGQERRRSAHVMRRPVLAGPAPLAFPAAHPRQH